MNRFQIEGRVKVALVCCLLGSALAVAGLAHNHPVTLMLYYFLGQPLLMVGFFLYLVTVWQDLLHHGVFRREHRPGEGKGSSEGRPERR